jgi:hypothetical protein
MKKKIFPFIYCPSIHQCLHLINVWTAYKFPRLKFMCSVDSIERETIVYQNKVPLICLYQIKLKQKFKNNTVYSTAVQM